jgi:hypothetical protein
MSVTSALEQPFEKAHPNFLARVTNPIVGCARGDCICSYSRTSRMALTELANGNRAYACLLVKGSSSWKLATAAAALNVSSAIIDHSSLTALQQAFRRTAEVILGEHYCGARFQAFFGPFSKDRGAFLKATRNNRLKSPKRTATGARNHTSLLRTV